MCARVCVHMHMYAHVRAYICICMRFRVTTNLVTANPNLDARTLSAMFCAEFWVYVTAGAGPVVFRSGPELLCTNTAKPATVGMWVGK